MTKEYCTMKIITSILCGILFICAPGKLSAQADADCSKLFYAYYEKLKRNKIVESYPDWKKVFDLNCSENFKYYDNILADGETILFELLENHSPTKTDSIKYGTLVKAIKERRVKSEPDLAIYWESAAVAAEYNYGLAPVNQVYAKLSDVFNRAKIKDSELTAEAVYSYFYAALEMYNAEKITATELMQAYSDDIKVIKTNATSRLVRFNELKLKKDSLGITKEEEADMLSAKEFGEYFQSIEADVASYMGDFANCDFLTSLYQPEYEANKGNLEWLNSTAFNLQNLIEGGCDSEFTTQVNDQFAVIYCQENPDACKQNSTANPDDSRNDEKIVKGDPDAKSALDNYRAKRYSAAIPYFKKVVKNSTGASKGTYAYYLADSYLKTGNRTNAVIWFKKSAQYKPSSAPYSQLASIFGDKRRINSCGKDNTTKLAAYLVAADYMAKAARYDGGLRKYVGQYKAVGSSESTWFKEGYKRGQRVKVTCYGGATTTLR